MNYIDVAVSLDVTDGGYLFSGGCTHRDWDALAAALEGTDSPVVISVPDEAEIKRRGSFH